MKYAKKVFGKLSFGLLSMSLVSIPTITTANTPDGVIPPVELICSTLTADGVSKGLYGLCLAYCAATDSPQNLTSEENIAELPNHSANILESYNKMRAPTDPQMPCATYYSESQCPAWTTEQRDIVGTHGYANRFDNQQDDVSLYDLEYDSDFFGPYQLSSLSVRDLNGGRSAVFYDYVYDRSAGSHIKYTYNIVHNLTQEEYDHCRNDILNHSM